MNFNDTGTRTYRKLSAKHNYSMLKIKQSQKLKRSHDSYGQSDYLNFSRVAKILYLVLAISR